jgi:hypothetical protein
MSKLVEIRNQEMMCRERALSDLARRDFWLAQAEGLEQRALDEIAFHFRESNVKPLSREAGATAEAAFKLTSKP